MSENEYPKLKKLIPFTDQDYDSIYSSMKNTMTELLPEYNDTSDTDPGMRIFQEIARVADVLSWKIDTHTNQSLPGNATLRKPALAYAKWMNYVPSQRKSSKCSDLKIEIMNDGRTFTIPKGTRFGTGYENDAIIFCTTKSIVCTPPDDCENGESYYVMAECENAQDVVEYVGVSDGSASQVFYLGNSECVDGSFIVEVLDENEKTVTKYDVVYSVFDVGFNENKVILSFDENNFGKLQFGDGVNGSIPNAEAQIVVRYKVGGGKKGNILAGFLTTCLDNIPGGLVLGCTNLSDTFGGEDIESVESINKNAPYHFVTGDRLVSFSDCKKWFESQYAVGDVAYEKHPEYIDTYIFYLAPKYRDDYDVIPREIKEEYLKTIHGDEENGIDGIGMIGDTYIISDPIWKWVDVDISITCSKLFSNSDIGNGVRQEIYDKLNTKKFAEELSVSDIYDAARSVDGVMKVRLNRLCLKGYDDITEIDCKFNEIIRAKLDDIVVSVL